MTFLTFEKNVGYNIDVRERKLEPIIVHSQHVFQYTIYEIALCYFHLFCRIPLQN